MDARELALLGEGGADRSLTREDRLAPGDRPLTREDGGRDECWWYWAAALYKAVHPERPRRRHLWERTVFLLRASDDAEARDCAHRIARGKETEYESALGDIVRWTFVCLEDVEPLHDEIEDGAEVNWQLFHRVDPKGAHGDAATE